MEHSIFGLIKKCEEIAGQHKLADTLKADLDAIDCALVWCRYEDDTTGIQRAASISIYSGALS
jgi:hypothetical protein